MRYVLVATGLLSFVLWLAGCATTPTQQEMEDGYRGGKTFCEAHRHAEVPMCQQ